MHKSCLRLGISTKIFIYISLISLGERKLTLVTHSRDVMPIFVATHMKHEIRCSVLFDCIVKMKNWGERLTKVEQLAQSFRSKPLTARYKPRLWPCEPSSVWNLFPRQSMAIAFAHRCKEVTPGFGTVLVYRFLISVHLFVRLSMFLHLKKKTRPRAKGSTWLLVIVSCGTTTGKIKSIF